MFKVQHHWGKYANKVDHLIEKAFRNIIKQSMQKLSRAINGDDKTSPNPLFKVLVALRQASPQNTPKVSDNFTADNSNIQHTSTNERQVEKKAASESEIRGK